MWNENVSKQGQKLGVGEGVVRPDGYSYTSSLRMGIHRPYRMTNNLQNKRHFYFFGFHPWEDKMLNNLVGLTHQIYYKNTMI